MTLYTVGYASLGFDPETIISKLRDLSDKYTAVIIDVRAKPWGLVNLPQLKERLGQKRYKWIKQLGNPAFETYASTMELKYINIIFMCAEQNHKQCHRTNVAEIQQRVRAKSEEVIHLYSTAIENEPRWDTQKTLSFFL